MKPDCNMSTLKMDSSKKVMTTIKRRFKTLPFTDRYLSEIQNCRTQLQILDKNGCIHSYPPLCVKNGYTAQYEHTIYIEDGKKIIFSKSDDY